MFLSSMADGVQQKSDLTLSCSTCLCTSHQQTLFQITSESNCAPTAYMQILHCNAYFTVHTANTDKTKQFCIVHIGGVKCEIKM